MNGEQPNNIRLSESKRVLFLTKDLDLIRKQLYEGLNLRMEDLSIEDLLDDINTDVMTPAWVCFDHDPSEIAKNAACGPPYPIGTPNLCILPTATSTPNSEIGLIKTCASGSIHAVTIISDLCAWDIKNVGSNNCPFLPGNCNKIPKTSS